MLLGGYVCHKIRDSYQVPQFRDFGNLEEHLKSTPGRRAKVLVEGRVGHPDISGKSYIKTIRSEKTGLMGAVGLGTRIECVVDEADREIVQQSDSTKKEVHALDPFKLWDKHGCCILVKSVRKADGLKQVVQTVYEEKPAPKKGYSVASGEGVSKSSALTRECLLLFGAHLAGYGEAVLPEPFAGGHVSFTPTEVGSSVQHLYYPNKRKASAWNCVSLVLFILGGGVIVFSGISLLVRFIHCIRKQIPPRPIDEEQTNNEEQQPNFRR